MRKYIEMLKYELKNIVRDKMMFMLLLFPAITVILFSYVIPKALTLADGGTPAAMYGTLICFVLLVSMNMFMIASLLGFVLLDRKDERTLVTIAATPLSIKGYLIFLSVYNFVIAFISTFIALAGTKLLASDSYTYEAGGMTIELLKNLTYGRIAVYSLSSSLLVIPLALLLSGLANNKIEGFAMMKMSGMLLVVPILALLETFNGGLQYVLGIMPNFWAVKGLLATVVPVKNTADLSFTAYMLIGSGFAIALIYPAYRFFMKRFMKYNT